jgi:hypothetical protein
VLLALFVLMLVLPLFVTSSSVGKALEHTKELVGILATIAGIGTSSLAFLRKTESANVMADSMPGLVGVLAGATLLEVGDWASPAALGAAGVSMAIAFGLKKPDSDGGGGEGGGRG